jgi:ABC-2 type transport system ATP-binding protein
MLHSPRLLLLDEPTAGVDPKARRDFWDELQGLAARGISVLVSTHYMDEASRCHKLAYIAYGKLLAQGTAAEIIASQSLSTWAIQGERLIELQENLRSQPGVSQTVIFGDGLHVSGTDPVALEETVRRIATENSLQAEKVNTGLEDVFIYMMSSSADNFGGKS